MCILTGPRRPSSGLLAQLSMKHMQLKTKTAKNCSSICYHKLDFYVRNQTWIHMVHINSYFYFHLLRFFKFG